MALKKCKECDNMVSIKAKICPHCGARVQKSRWAIVIPLSLLFGACVIIFPLMAGRRIIADKLKNMGIETNLKIVVEESVRQVLNEEYGITCISTDLLEGEDGSLAGTAKLEDGREIDIQDARIDGEMIRFKHIVKPGYEYKCRHHIAQLQLITSPENGEQGILSGNLWNDGIEPIRGFVVAEFVDDENNVNKRYRVTIPFPPNGNKIFDWVPPGKKAEFKYPVSSELLKKDFINVRLEFFNLGNESFASITYDIFDENILESIPVKVTSQICEIQKEQVNSEEWNKIQEEFDNYKLARILMNMYGL